MSFDGRFFMELVSDTLYRPFEFPITAVTGSTWAYPFIGVIYFLSHPELWGPVLSIIVPQVIITTTVFFLVHAFFYIPQAGVAFFFNGPTGLFTAWIMVLHQSGIISRAIVEALLLPGPLKKIFDSVIKQNGPMGYTAKLMVQSLEEQQLAAVEAKKTRQQRAYEWWAKFRDSWIKCLSDPYYYFKFACICFFNFIPFFGPYVLIFLRSPGKARNLHARYFTVKKMSEQQRYAFFNANRAYYTSFGLVALNLELIPVLGMFFTFSNIVAASLWSCDLEKEAEKKLKQNKLL